MTYRNDLDALAARKQALELEVAERTRERDETARLLEEMTKRVRLPLLDQIKVSAPCSESWDLMQGDDKVRHCAKCDQQVFNLSAMTREDAETLVRDKHGNLCARYFQRKDGTIITQNCPVGVRRQRRGLAIAAGALATVVGGSSVLASVDVEEPPFVAESNAIMGAMASPKLVEGELPWGCDGLQRQLDTLAACDPGAAAAIDPIGDWKALDAAVPKLNLEQLVDLNATCTDRTDAAYRATEALCPPDKAR